MKQGIYFVTDRNSSLHHTPEYILKSVLDAGVSWVQFREKELSDSKFLKELDQFLKVTSPYSITTIVNDRLELCQDYPVSGFHIGLSDLKPQLARDLCSKDKILGLSLEKVPGWENYLLEPVDYFGVSPIFPTPTKKDTLDHWGWDGLKEIRLKTSLPLTAIGGLKKEQIPDAKKHGADLFAVVTAFTQSEDPFQTAKEYLRIWNETL